MNKRRVLVNEKNDVLEIQNNRIPKFVLLGIFECVVFGMKSPECRELFIEQKEIVDEHIKYPFLRVAR